MAQVTAQPLPDAPTAAPTDAPSLAPSAAPTASFAPTINATANVTTDAPSLAPTPAPSNATNSSSDSSDLDDDDDDGGMDETMLVWIIILAVVFVCSFSVACCLKVRRERLEAAAAGAQEAEPLLNRWKAGRRWRKETLREAYAGRATQYGAGSDIVFAGGGVTNHATLRALLDRVDAATAALANDSTSVLADDVFAFDVSVLDAIPELRGDFSTPTLLRKAFPQKLLGGAHWQLLSLGPSRAGLPMHAHGETWLGVVHGAKLVLLRARRRPPRRRRSIRWRPRAPGTAPSTAKRATSRRPASSAPATFLPAPGWKHATLNVGETVAVGGQLGYGAAERFEFSKRALANNPRDVEALHGAGIAAAHLAFEGRPELFRESVAYLSRARRATSSPRSTSF
ncbi:hypothetical protein JL721_8560 [Aureococcus anophagefferens]|nr:hypothetical protein JL721_8560 [Aureococcus anophagefferens]